jgi:DnaJ-class molecular chaperone
VLCRVRAHRLFRRDGLDVLLDLHLTFPQAALGAEVEIATPDGPALLKVPPGTSSGAKLRLRDRGVRDARTGQQGDLYAVVKIDVPRDLSTRARQLIEALARELPGC